MIQVNFNDEIIGCAGCAMHIFRTRTRLRTSGVSRLSKVAYTLGKILCNAVEQCSGSGSGSDQYV